MDWFRSYHGAPADTKLTIVARKAEQPRAIVTAVWWELLDYASQNNPRGSIKGIDFEIIATQQDLECNTVKRIVTTMQQRGMIDQDLGLAAWEKRQPKREDDGVNERVKRYREKKRMEAETLTNQAMPADTNSDVTRCNADVTHDNAPEQTTEERREDVLLLARAKSFIPKGEIASEFADSTVNFSDFNVSLGVVCLLLSKRTLSKKDQKILELLCTHYDMRHVLTVVHNELKKFQERGDGEYPNSLAYFCTAIYQQCQSLRIISLKVLKNPPGSGPVIPEESEEYFKKFDEGVKERRVAAGMKA